MEKLQISYPGYFLILIAVLAIIYAFSLYFRDSRIKENKSWLPFLLSIIRFLTVLGILFLLLFPLFKNFITEKQKPLIVVLEDKSASVNTSNDASTLEKVTSGLNDITAALNNDFDIVEIDFAENFITASTDSLINQSTNISGPLEYISETFEDQNLGAIILATDGIYNEGKNPLYSDMQFSVPIYTVPLGDTTIRTDILIKNVLHNRIVYLNDKFNIEVDVQAYNSKGAKSKVQLYKQVGGKNSKLDSKSIIIDKDIYFKTISFDLDADQIGNVKYFVSVTAINNEVSTANNSRNVYLEILDARQKILLLANNTHPDLKALKQIINENKNYELEIKLVDQTTPNIRSYDIIMLHGLPSNKNNIENTLNTISNLKKPVFFINSATTALAAFNKHQDVLQINGGNNSLNAVTPIYNDQFDLFTLKENIGSELKKYVPLKASFGDYKLAPTSKVLLNQKVGTIETSYPLLAYSDVNNHKEAVLTGEGLWRWRLYEYQEYKAYPNSKELITKTLQYISQKEDKRQFRAFVSKNSYKENEAISFDAQLYNANYESINTPEAQLVITNESKEKFNYTFSKVNNYYFIDQVKFPEGNYSFTATTNYNGKELKASGKFNVESIIKEQYDLTARHDLLHSLSSKFGGEVIYPDQISGLKDKLLTDQNIKPILYQKAQTTPMLNLKWLLGILIFLLAIEWFLRRYFGGY